MESFAWMAWTRPTADLLRDAPRTLSFMTALATVFPRPSASESSRIPTTRGDRLFVSLILTAVIYLLWIGFVGTDAIATLPIGEEGFEISSPWLATLISLATAVLVFRTV